MALGLTQLLIEMSTMNISWGVKAACACGWKPYDLRVPVFLKSGNLNLLEPSGPEYTWTRTALPLHSLLHEVLIMEVRCVFCGTKTEFLYLIWISFEFKSVYRRINSLRQLKKKVMLLYSVFTSTVFKLEQQEISWPKYFPWHKKLLLQWLLLGKGIFIDVPIKV